VEPWAAGGGVPNWKRPRLRIRIPPWTLAAVIAIGCLLYAVSRPLHGQVLDRTSKRAIPNATVLVIWRGDAAGATESNNQCVHAEITTADAQGHYRIENWFGLWYGKFLMLSDAKAIHVAFKPGYRSLTELRQTGADIVVEPFAGSKDEWFQEIRGGLVTCVGRPFDTQSNLSKFYNAILADVESTAETSEQKKVVAKLRMKVKLNMPNYRPGGDSNEAPSHGN
jgi:hypothetical protein